ncbi:hypothetical protein TPHA_0F01690 [Tetrapisispora phaffii CBS 4417]|uniref:MICOS complex subunit MIC27 n=1 Tax=Tetrapisispora phaffii (strain ATCC 24235 / CBS 4417 / NBRC 1672 / NRRL Y-8282 / UCD 70-5) TaxID=1071381 RepID=G8BV71_TETPH|nr:hypothetical protein TPHA_0F01690 [Tetrapisispora phaffii CBS 4417]CCE63653.1 hypothetical protein TPHA_0F01690 [Tetrapisispora phaffii CBS 4417]
MFIYNVQSFIEEKEEVPISKDKVNVPDSADNKSSNLNIFKKIDQDINNDLVNYTLDSGSKVTESKELTSWIHRWRTDVVDKYRFYSSSIKSQEEKLLKDKQNATKYIYSNILTDDLENSEDLVPGATLSLLAFFTGRVLTNKRNWSRINGTLVKSSFMGKTLTSIPSRVVIPVFFACYTMKTFLPVTFQNLVNTIENDMLPRKFVNDYHELWNVGYVNGIQKSCNNLHASINNASFESVRKLRELVDKVFR